jgi:hypothetical protein
MPEAGAFDNPPEVYKDQPPVTITEKAPTSIIIGTPLAGSVCHEPYLFSVINTGNYLKSHGIDKGLATVGGSWTAEARNTIAALFMADKLRTHLMFIDGDIAWKPQDVKRLIDADVPIIGALYPRKHLVWEAAAGWDGKNVVELSNQVMRRSWPCEPVGERVADRVPVDWLQTGFLLIRRDALEIVRAHKGETHAYFGPKEEPMYSYFDYPLRESKGKMRRFGEDYAFCKDAQAAGLQVWRLLDVELRHVGQVTF